MNVISNHLDKILGTYLKDVYYDEMKEALKVYIERTGKMNEESEEYESRMNCFNDWFIFNHVREDGTRIIDRYILDEKLDGELAKSLHNVNFSLFLFQKTNFKKQIVIKDILHDKKYILAKDNETIALLEDDLFIGRVVTLEDATYLLKGVCLLPRNILSTLKKESKKVRKLSNDVEEEKFLLNIEKLKTKSTQYGHLDASKIFDFKK